MLYICCRAVALGLTAEDMVAVQDLQCIYAIYMLYGCSTRSDSRGYGGGAGLTVYLCYIFTVCCRAVALGLTAEDMVAVQDFQEEIKAKRVTQQKVSDTAEIIKKEVAMQETSMRVGH